MSYSITKFPFEPIDINEGLNVLSIENPNTYFSYVSGLQDSEDKLVVSRDGKIDETKKSISFIGDITQIIDLNKMYQKEAIKSLLVHFDDAVLRRLNELDSEINNVISKVIIDNNLPISIFLDFNIENIIKMEQVKIEAREAITTYDKIQSIVDLSAEFNDKRLIVFTNVYQYLNQEQVDYLSYNLKLKELFVLAIERSNVKLTASEAVNSVFIDQDYVEF